MLLGKKFTVVSLRLWVKMEESSVATGYENVFFKNKTVVVDLGKNIAELDFVEPVKNCLKFFLDLHYF